MPALGPFVLYYHTACTVFWGRAFAPVAILKLAGAEYAIKPMPESPSGAGFAVPMVTFPGGYTISQTPVIVHSLGKHFGMVGSGDADDFVSNQLLADSADFLGEIFACKPGIILYNYITYYFISLTIAIADRINKWLSYFQGKLGEKEFFLGSSHTCADYSIFAGLYLISEKLRVGSPAAAGYTIPESLQKYMKRVHAIPVISEMLSSVPILPESRL